MKNILIGIALLVIVSGMVGFITYGNRPNPAKEVNITPTITTKEVITTQQPVDYTSSFAIFTNGTFRIFTVSMYHNRSINVYIEAGNPNIIHIKKAGTAWNDFFSTLPFTLTHECLTTGTKETFCNGSGGTLKFYLNGERKETILNEEIQNSDKLLVTYGNESEAIIKKQIDKIPQ